MGRIKPLMDPGRHAAGATSKASVTEWRFSHDNQRRRTAGARLIINNITADSPRKTAREIHLILRKKIAVPEKKPKVLACFIPRFYTHAEPCRVAMKTPGGGRSARGPSAKI